MCARARVCWLDINGNRPPPARDRGSRVVPAAAAPAALRVAEGCQQVPCARRGNGMGWDGENSRAVRAEGRDTRGNPGVCRRRRRGSYRLRAKQSLSPHITLPEISSLVTRSCRIPCPHHHHHHHHYRHRFASPTWKFAYTRHTAVTLDSSPRVSIT